jgi:hypothetical protein
MWQDGPGLRLGIQAVIVRLASLAPFSIGYLVAASLTRWPSASASSLRLAGTLRRTVNRRTLPKLWFAAVLLAAVTLYPLIVKVGLAGGISSFLDVAYQMRFGTHGETPLENSAIVMASLMSGPFTAIIALLAMRAADGASRSAGTVVLLISLVSFNIVVSAAHGRRIGIAIAVLVPLIAWQLQQPLRHRALAAIALTLLLAALALNVLHFHRYAMSAGWDERSLSDTASDLLTPQGHLQTLGAVLSTADSKQELGGRQYLDSAVSLFPRILWKDKPEVENLGSLAIQGWADLPTHYQMAPTDVGEAIACFGPAGLIVLIGVGIWYATLDRLSCKSIAARAAVVGVGMTRVLVDQGMGVAALAISVVMIVISFLLIRSLLPRCPTQCPEPTR